MTEKNIQIKSLTGDLLFPKTKGALVENNNGDALGGVEAGAQVNKIEKIKVNGTELTITSKAVDISVPDYTITKASSADAGFAATYQLFKGGVATGDKINIPKDMVVSGAELKNCATADQPVASLAVGDPYIEMTIANSDGSKIYIPVKDLVDVYTAGNGLTLTNGAFSVNTGDTNTVDASPTQNSTKLVQSGGVHTALAGKQETIDSDHKLDADLVDDSNSTHKFVSASEKSTWNGKQDLIDASHKLSADLLSAGSTNAVLTIAEKNALMTTLTYEEIVSA